VENYTKVIKSWGSEEMYEEIFECPHCENIAIFYSYIYCPICGIELDWSFIHERDNK